MSKFERTEMLLGSAAVEKLKNSHVAVFGAGGVGGHAIEALVRSGLGEITIVDMDTVSESNINRQAFATVKTVGMPKVDAAEERIREINPDCTVHKLCQFYLPETEFDFTQYDYVIDAIDTVAGKLSIAEKCTAAETPVIAAMGAGNKIDPTKFVVTDIYKTSVCPLAAIMRRELRKRGVPKLKVVYSTEPALKPLFQPEEESGDPMEENAPKSRRVTPASAAFVPSVCGLIIAGEVIRDLCGIGLDGSGREMCEE
jgi:tRNA A37 threonylcarbamoyladenosine dehydratase